MHDAFIYEADEMPIIRLITASLLIVLPIAANAELIETDFDLHANIYVWLSVGDPGVEYWSHGGDSATTSTSATVELDGVLDQTTDPAFSDPVHSLSYSSLGFSDAMSESRIDPEPFSVGTLSNPLATLDSDLHSFASSPNVANVSFSSATGNASVNGTISNFWSHDLYFDGQCNPSRFDCDANFLTYFLVIEYVGSGSSYWEPPNPYSGQLPSVEDNWSGSLSLIADGVEQQVQYARDPDIAIQFFQGSLEFSGMLYPNESIDFSASIDLSTTSYRVTADPVTAVSEPGTLALLALGLLGLGFARSNRRVAA